MSAILPPDVESREVRIAPGRDWRGVLADLLPALRRLDSLLARAAARVPEVYGAHVDGDEYRGLHVSPADVATLLGREPGTPTLYVADPGSSGTSVDGDDDVATGGTTLGALAAAFGLVPFEVDVLLLAIAPELDLRYERLYAYLQDDVTRRRPTVGLALDLLSPDAAARLAHRAHFAPGAPLIRHLLLDLSPDGAGPAGPPTPLLARSLAVDEGVVNLLLGQDTLDRRLAGSCRYLSADRAFGPRVLGASAMAGLMGAAREILAGGAARRIHFHGPRGSGKRGTAGSLAATLGAPLLDVDVARLVDLPDFARLVALALRDAWLRDAVVYLRNAQALLHDDRAVRRAELEAALAAGDVLAVLSSTVSWPEADAADATTIAFGQPGHAQRAAIWADALDGVGADVPDETVRALASRFRLTPRQIALAAADGARAAGSGFARADTTEPDAAGLERALFAAARRQSGHELAALATRITPVHRWESLVLPDDGRAQLRELCQRVTSRHRVLDDWGFARLLPRGTGINALFAGPSGTGKTMAAEVVAAELGVDLYRVELAGVVSKYIGETEKNLDRIFAAAERANGILLFDEADALFGKRSEVHDAHDRYANIEISYLLQRMEEYDGIAILSTNLRGNLDAAFVRRLAFTVHFPFPDAASRAAIWRGVWPAEVPLADDVDLDALAAHFPVSGGNIRNIALAAAFLAAADGGVVVAAHLAAATRREYQKLGKELSASEMGPFGAAGA
ncbi:MAG: ATP-binding protein [Gemmatimonadaceae bacterium]